MAEIYCPRCKEDINIIEFNESKLDVVCGFCGFSTIYENAKEANIKLADFVDRVENRIAGGF